MNYFLYSIRDLKTGFMSPAMEMNDAAAARNFTHAVLHSDGILYSHAQDFSLFRIAEFDSDSGVVSPVVPPVLVLEGSMALNYGGESS